MAVIDVPNNFAFAAFAFQQARFDYGEVSDANGSSADRLGGPPRWAAQLKSLEEMDLVTAGQWAAMLLKLRGRVNHLSVFDPLRTAPQGTMRGTPTLGVPLARGATSMTLSGNGSLLPGDLLQVGTGVGTSQLLVVTEPATSNAGSISVSFEAPSRYGFPAGTAVIWDHPRFYAKIADSQPGPSWDYARGAALQGNFAINVMEQW